MKKEQLTSGHVFRIFPDSIVLIAEEEGTIETADDQGNFDLKTYFSYEVRGESLAVAQKSTLSCRHIVQQQQ